MRRIRNLLDLALKTKAHNDEVKRKALEIAKLEENLYNLNIQECFEKEFKDIIPLLKKSGISYSVQMNNSRYPHLGYYILFQKNGKSALMDFSASGIYRYEHSIEGTGSMCYGKWPHDRFALWLATELCLIQE
jgi:hypothetical protein